MTQTPTHSAASPSAHEYDFNRRDHPDRPQRPIPPGRDHFSPRWLPSRQFLFGPWIDVEERITPTELTRARDDYFWQADEHMSDVAAMFEDLGQQRARADFEQALTVGIETVTAPHPALVAFFAHLDTVPDWFDRESADRGRTLVLSATLLSTALTGGWAFFETAMTGDISASTGATGRFKDQAPRRYIETVRMFAMVLKPEVFDRDAPAFHAAVRVRLMHALVTRGLKRKWGDDVYRTYGEPIAASSLLGFGNGPLLVRLADHSLGRTLTRSQLDDLAMYSAHISWLLGAPESLRCRDGIELVHSLDYIFSRGGEPSKWRVDLVDSQSEYTRQVVGMLGRHLPAFARARIIDVLDRQFAMAGIMPLAMIFGADQVNELIDGTRFERFGIDYAKHSRRYEWLARTTARLASVRDQVPGAAALRHRYHRNGPGLQQIIDALDGVLGQMNMRSTYTHHDRSTTGKTFTG